MTIKKTYTPSNRTSRITSWLITLFNAASFNIQHFYHHYYLSIRTLSFYLFPASCLLCRENTNRLFDLCQYCEANLPYNQPSCSQCGLPLPKVLLHQSVLYQEAPLAMTAKLMETSIFNEVLLCGACIARAPKFDRCLAPLLYDIPVNQLISRFKYQGQLIYGAVLAEIFLRFLQIYYVGSSQRPRPELIVPVPLHWKRQLLRGFNQSQWLAEYLGQHLYIPVNHRLLKRIRNTPPQQGLSRQQRKRNLTGAFKVKDSIAGKHIVLVDDVVTTGSTVSELAQLLKKAGASKVEIWCLARTPLDK